MEMRNFRFSLVINAEVYEHVVKICNPAKGLPPITNFNTWHAIMDRYAIDLHEVLCAVNINEFGDSGYDGMAELVDNDHDSWLWSDEGIMHGIFNRGTARMMFMESASTIMLPGPSAA